MTPNSGTTSGRQARPSDGRGAVRVPPITGTTSREPGEMAKGARERKKDTTIDTHTNTYTVERVLEWYNLS